ncbi:uncharacterized protein N7458_010593 [Penicillium daleae]|uniref:Protein kinase domain-containing protein n=1 Tax=Penicillium daleae TaxID=63821 RepID=A0AAD6BZP3_9EURO|nr:uncharacterized protein N7458_010593 [Penicillium daleae]KAJ5439595.1 hypothetical protein N7458_010593 [Penicillium daleae]
MAQPYPYEPTSIWWPEDRIKATLDTKYVVSRLRPENVPRLFDLPRWGEGLTSETYMEWILLKAGRLFLILEAIGIPDRIFALVDASCDDDDLPVAEQNVDRLCLSPVGNDLALDTEFFHAQWRYLVRGLAEGEHVTYTQNEGVPVEAVQTAIGVQGREDSADKVVLAGAVCRMYLRAQVQVGGAPHFFSTAEVLEEIRGLRKLVHPHLISIYASYFVDDTVCALFTGAEIDRTLYSFLTDEPPTFKQQSKEFRRQTLIAWPHCLVSALAWLHARGHAHAAIRPSNIHVDPNFKIYFGQFQALDTLFPPPRLNDLEAYQYSAPERWVRSAAPTIQPSVPSKTLLPSGGRTGRRKKPSQQPLSTVRESSPPLSPDYARPDSAASKGTVIRISPSRFSLAISSSSSSSSAASTSTYTDNSRNTRSTGLKPHRSGLWTVILDIITHLCKRSLSSFASHRSARNRSAGRGGGMADASFHLDRNAVQVQSWIALLEGDALKRCRRDRGSDRAYHAVPRMLIVLRAMLAAEPEKRPPARRVMKSFASAMREVSGKGGEIVLHCSEVEQDEKKRRRREAVIVQPGRKMKLEEEVIVEEENELEEPGMPKEEAFLDESSSVSDFDFGFSDVDSDSEPNEAWGHEHKVDVIHRSISELEVPMQAKRVTPHLSLPSLDVHIRGIEGLTFRNG